MKARMTAQEVLRRYAAGERKFCDANLRGANFKGKDLSGADFSGADIRSANFTNAVLHGANFTKTRGGLQQRWMWLQLLLFLLVTGIGGLIQGYVSDLAAVFLDGTSEGILRFSIYFSLLIVIFAVIALYGFAVRSFIFVSAAATVAVTVAAVLSVSVIGAISLTVTVAIAFAFTGAFVFTGMIPFAVGVVGALTVTVIVAYAISGALAVVITVAITVIGLSFSVYVGQQALQENKKFANIRLLGLILSTLGGTSFCGADLTYVTFDKASLKNTNFANSRQQETIFTRVYWQGGSHLNRARLGSSILQDHRVRRLLTTSEKGYKQDLSYANFRGANLSGVTLEKANLTRAILSDGLLRGTVLKDAILTEAQAVNADFTNACLTGATIEAWNIDSTTIFKDIDCNYVYLLEHPKINDDRERRPHDITKMFQPGDFEKLFKEVQDEVQLLIRNGLNPGALRCAFQRIRENYPELPEDALQSFQRRGNDILVTVKVPQSIDKGEFERDWDSGFQVGLQAGRDESAALLASVEKRANSLEAIALTMAQNPPSIQNNQNMTGNDHSQTIEVQGNVDRSVIGQGDHNNLKNAATPKNEPKNDSAL